MKTVKALLAASAIILSTSAGFAQTYGSWNGGSSGVGAPAGLIEGAQPARKQLAVDQALGKPLILQVLRFKSDPSPFKSFVLSYLLINLMECHIWRDSTS